MSKIPISIRAELAKTASPAKAKILSGFFKTGAGQYGAGDIFIGVVVPAQRLVAGQFWRECTLTDLHELLSSKIHEHRLTALIILVKKYSAKEITEIERKGIYNFYLRHTARINNWDLVDLSAPQIVGGYLLQHDRSVLYRLVQSTSLWEKRIAIISTFTFIRQNQFDDTLAIAKMLLSDNRDLIHKAVGWMLREIGKRDIKAEEKFLSKHCKFMPRTMLRYAIEKFPESKRKFYLNQ